MADKPNPLDRARHQTGPSPTPWKVGKHGAGGAVNIWDADDVAVGYTTNAYATSEAAEANAELIVEAVNDAAEPPIGTIHDKDAMFLLQHIGEANDDDGNPVYELLTGNAYNPVIQSKKTGKKFSLSWADVVTLAIQAGIDLDT